VVRETIKSARTGEIRTLLVQRGESSRVEVRDGEGRAVLEIHMGMVRRTRPPALPQLVQHGGDRRSSNV
jgi:hypothetical protein